MFTMKKGSFTGLPRTKNYCINAAGSANRIIKWLLLVLLFPASSLSLFAVEKESLTRLENENRALSSAIELHLTATDSALVNSTVSLDHEDAWLFFDNIRPSEVIAKYRSEIFIGGALLAPGSNARIAIYKHGTVVMPHDAGYQPLTVFTDENLSGDSLALSIGIYHNNLGRFDNAIQSFRLKRGYMATLANNPDGTGYSRVFIADNEDKKVNLPDFLINKVSFIRVFKHEWVTKKGWAGWNANEIKMANVTCYYDWNVGGTTTENYEYTPIRQNGGWPSWSDINSKQNVTHLLGFNEPDRPDQANMQFQDMIDQWPEMLKSGLRVGSPAWSNPWGGNGGNLFDFIDKCDELNYRVDFVALHCYWGGKSPQNWYNDLKYIHERTGRPLWITEWNNGANWTNEWWPNGRGYNSQNAQKQLNDLKGILQVLDTASFVERYFIYNWVEDCRAIILNGELTLAGEYYASNKSAVAYNSKNEVIPDWNFKKPELSYRYFSLRNSIRFSWTNENGELIDKYMLEKKTDSGEYQTIYSGDDISQMFFLDPLDSAKAGHFTCRLSLVTPRGDQLTSNEVSYYLATGENELRSGIFGIGNTEINTAFFNKKYSSSPVIIPGVPDFNNPIPLTWRVRNTSNTQFTFFLSPWSTLNTGGEITPVQLSFLALPAGTYDFGGLQAEVNSANGVGREWVQVNFIHPFENTPVVFPALASPANAFPLAVAVRNVTTSGFQICLKSDATVTVALAGETINFLAIEPGTGNIQGKRVVVGRNFNENGISSLPVEISIDSVFEQPAVFAGLLSANDPFASIMRYQQSGPDRFQIIKQAAEPGDESLMQTDDFGWMVMDLSARQTVVETAIMQYSESKRFFYPNPATGSVFFNFDRPRKVILMNLAGQTVVESVVERSLDITNLSPGIYMVKTDGFVPQKLIVTTNR